MLSLIPQLMALKDSVSAPVVRPPWNDTVLIKRLLDAGFYNFLIPFVETAEEARARRGRHALPAARRARRLGVAARQPLRLGPGLLQQVVNDQIA